MFTTRKDPHRSSGSDRPAPGAIEHLLVPGEVLDRSIATDNRWIHLTDRRLVVVEKDGDWSVIPLAQVGAVEISDDDGDGCYVKVFFGGGLDRTFRTRTPADAAAIAGSLAR